MAIWEIENFMREIVERYKNMELTREKLNQLIFVLQGKFDFENHPIGETDADFVLHNNNRIKCTIWFIRSLLAHTRVYTYYGNGARFYLPLFLLAYYIFHKEIDDDSIVDYLNNFDSGNSDYHNMKRFMYNTMLNGVFENHEEGLVVFDTSIQLLGMQIKYKKNTEFPTTELFEMYSHLPVRFSTEYTCNNLDQLNHSFVLFLMYDLKRKIEQNEMEYIMPKSRLESLCFESSKINSIRNIHLTDYNTDWKIKSENSFVSWVNNPACVKDKKAYLNLHLIPTDETLWSEDKFEEFIQKRGELILHKIKKYATVCKETFIQTYVGKIDVFSSIYKRINGYRELPAPFVPGVGSSYWDNPRIPKIAFVGKDVGRLKKIGDMFDDVPNYVSFYSEVLDEFDIIDSWPNHYGTYGGMILEILSAIYGVSVEELKSGQYTRTLNSFVWAQTEAIQNFKAANQALPQLSLEVWQLLNEKVQHLNKLSLLLETTNPNVVIITSWDIDDYYDVTDFVEIESEYHLRLLKHTERNQYIIHTSHPQSWSSDLEDKPFERRIAQIVSLIKNEIYLEHYFGERITHLWD